MFIELLAALGLTFILKQGSIFNSPRKFLIGLHPKIKELFDCGMCLGFWSGITIGILSDIGIISTLILGFASSFLGFITHHILVIAEKIFDYFNSTKS